MPPEITPKRLIIVAVIGLAIILSVFFVALYYIEQVKV